MLFCHFPWVLTHQRRPFSRHPQRESTVCFISRHTYQLHMWLLRGERMSGGFQKVKPQWNLPGEVLLPQHVARNRWVPGRGDLGRLVHWLGLHRPQIVVADMVVYHGGEGWREGQTSRGKERMIKTHVNFSFQDTERPKMACPMLLLLFPINVFTFHFTWEEPWHCSRVIAIVLYQRTQKLVKLSIVSVNIYTNKRWLICQLTLHWLQVSSSANDHTICGQQCTIKPACQIQVMWPGATLSALG